MIDVLSPWVIWLILALIGLIAEIATAGFGVICFSVGALAASALAALSLSLTWQIIGFCVGSLLAFVFVRPVMLKWLDGSKNKQKINLDSIIGRKAVVVEEITETSGRVAVDGTDWKARHQYAQTVAKGEVVTIVERNVNTLIIK